jgi:hypothetical protein
MAERGKAAAAGSAAAVGPRRARLPEAATRALPLLGALATAALAVLVALAVVQIRSLNAGPDGSKDPLILRAVHAVQLDDGLQAVRHDLPSLAVEPFTHVEELDTLGFMDVVNRSQAWDEVTLVSFYDPRSESFKVGRSALEEAAGIIKGDPELERRVRVVAVNIAVNSFLQMQFSRETTEAWQEDSGNKTVRKSFMFGKMNFYPLIIKVSMVQV